MLWLLVDVLGSLCAYLQTSDNVHFEDLAGSSLQR